MDKNKNTPIVYEYRTPSDTKHPYITICARGGKKAEIYNTFRPQKTNKYYQTNSTYNCANGWN
jgi:hypothetical protein